MQDIIDACTAQVRIKHAVMDDIELHWLEMQLQRSLRCDTSEATTMKVV